jgi:hypothetical protein
LSGFSGVAEWVAAFKENRVQNRAAPLRLSDGTRSLQRLRFKAIALNLAGALALGTPDEVEHERHGRGRLRL